MADQLSIEVEENDGAKRVVVVFTPVEQVVEVERPY